MNLIHTVVLNYSSQRSQDRNVLRSGNDVESQNVSASIATMISNAVTVTPSLAINIIDSKAFGKMTTSNMGLRVGSRLFGNRLSSVLGGNYTASGTIRIMSVSSQMSVRITKTDNLRLALSYTGYDDRSATNKDYSESTANINLSHRF